MRILFVVESPGKIKKLQEELSKDKKNTYIVMASFGHMMDLPAKGMNIDIDNGFQPTYEIIPRQKEKVAALRAAYEKCDMVYLAADADREGEFIAYSVRELLKAKKYKRVRFAEITKKAIADAISNPGDIDMNLVNAQQERRLLDRLMGYLLSPLVMKKLPGSLSAGRVQSSALRITVDREAEIAKFFEDGADAFFRVRGNFTYKKNLELKTVLYELGKNDNDSDGEDSDEASSDEEEEKTEEEDDTNGKVVEKGPKAGKRKIAELGRNSKTANDAEKFLERCSKSKFIISDVRDRNSIRNPSPPFMTASLQQEAGGKLGFNVKRTMSAAQHLYEGGHITYMRTDSIILSKEATEKIKGWVVDKYGKDYYKLREYSNKGGNAQEAHEAIRPSNPEIQDLPNLGDDERRLYSLIWKRTVASQMAAAQFAIKEIDVTGSKIPGYAFMAHLERLLFPGYLAVYNYKTEDDENAMIMEEKIDVKRGADVSRGLIEAKQEYSRPPPRYSEATLVREMKKLGIGRPATYAATIEKLISRSYVQIEDVEGQRMNSWIVTLDTSGDIDKVKKDVWIGKENKRLVPTGMGIKVTNFLVESFPEVMSYKFTASMEEKLDQIASGKLNWVKVLDKFYKMFAPEVERIMGVLKEEAKKKKDSGEIDYDRIIGETKAGTVYAKDGRWGPYLIMVCKDGTVRREKLPPKTKMEKVTLEQAIELLQYPKLLGKKDGIEVYLKRGPYGYYVAMDKKTANIKEEDLDKIDLAIATGLLKEKDEAKQQSVLHEFETKKRKYVVMLGKKPDKSGNVSKFVMVKDKDSKGNVKKEAIFVGIGDRDPKSITEEIVEALLAEKVDKRKSKYQKKTGAKEKGADDATGGGNGKSKATSTKAKTKKTGTVAPSKKKAKSSTKKATSTKTKKKTASTTKKAAKSSTSKKKAASTKKANTKKKTT
jgi:DNA topoisomerase-1